MEGGLGAERGPLRKAFFLFLSPTSTSVGEPDIQAILGVNRLTKKGFFMRKKKKAHEVALCKR